MSEMSKHSAVLEKIILQPDFIIIEFFCEITKEISLVVLDTHFYLSGLTVIGEY